MNTKLICVSRDMKPLLLRCWASLAPLPSSSSGGGSGSSGSRAYSRAADQDVFQANAKVLNEFWDEEGLFKALHHLNYLRLPYVRDALLDAPPADALSACLQGKKILDAGCGAGLLAEGLARYGAQVTGIDTNELLLQMARQHSAQDERLARNPPVYLHTTVEEHSREFPEHYDAVVASEVLEHVQQQERFVGGCARAARRGGKLLFGTPTRTRAAQLYMIYVFENVLRVYPKNAHKYSKFLKPNELQHMLEINDCRVASVRGYVYRPLAAYWHWTSSTWFSFATEAVKVA